MIPRNTSSNSGDRSSAPAASKRWTLPERTAGVVQGVGDACDADKRLEATRQRWSLPIFSVPVVLHILDRQYYTKAPDTPELAAASVPGDVRVSVQSIRESLTRESLSSEAGNRSSLQSSVPMLLRPS